jgi:adenosylmethionine-8-amino-7-oxononanoate aminotransferase
MSMEVMDKEKLTALGKKYLLLNFGQDESAFDLEGAIVASGDGCYIVDMDGKRYFEVGGAHSVLTLGYSHPKMVEAVCEQTKKITLNPQGVPPTVPAILLAEKIASISPEGMTKTFFAVTGSYANEAAVKMARQYFKIRGKGDKYKTITRWHGYTGSTLAMTSASGHSGPRRISFEPLPGGFILINAPYCYRCPYKMTYPDCGIECANELRRTLEYESPETVACFLGEIVLGSGGEIPPPPGYWQRIRQICDEFDILMVADEVITGFGKTGNWFASQTYGVVPDMMTMGKCITGGYAPLSALHVKQEIAKAFSGSPDGGFHTGFTFSGNPLSCAVALANIKLIEELGLIAEVPKNHDFIMSELEKIRQTSRIVGDVRGVGLMLGLEMVKDPSVKEDFPDAAKFNQTMQREAKKLGLHIANPGTRIHIVPPLNVSMEDLQFLMDALAKLVKKLEAEFL